MTLATFEAICIDICPLTQQFFYSAFQLMLIIKYFDFIYQKLRKNKCVKVELSLKINLFTANQNDEKSLLSL